MELQKKFLKDAEKVAFDPEHRRKLNHNISKYQVNVEKGKKQFNDLAVLREQVRKLKEELSVARRLDWIRRGIYGSRDQKGAEMLAKPAAVPASAPAANADLNVEIKQGGGVKIETGTNAPPK